MPDSAASCIRLDRNSFAAEVGVSEFSKLATALITPLLKANGFKKHGAFTRAPLHDEAIYRKGNTEVILSLQCHPCDYPCTGIQVAIKQGRRTSFRKLYPSDLGSTQALLEAIAGDLSGHEAIATSEDDS